MPPVASPWPTYVTSVGVVLDVREIGAGALGRGGLREMRRERDDGARPARRSLHDERRDRRGIRRRRHASTERRHDPRTLADDGGSDGRRERNGGTRASSSAQRIGDRRRPAEQIGERARAGHLAGRQLQLPRFADGARRLERNAPQLDAASRTRSPTRRRASARPAPRWSH